MHNLAGRAQFPAPQLRSLKKKPLQKGGFFFRPHGVGVNEVHIITPTRYNLLVYYVYVLQSLKKTDWLYKGSTSDLKRRFKEHNSGKNFSTAPYLPFRLIYYEAYLLKSDAEAREKYLKTSMGKRVLKKQLSNFIKTLNSDKIVAVPD